MQEGSNWDLLVAGIASLCLIFIIMLLLTRAVIASAVIVGTVLLALGTSFGMSVLIWEHLPGKPLHWLAPARSAIILVAGGAGCKPLLGVPFQSGIHPRIKDGLLRAV